MKNNAFIGFACVFLAGALLMGCAHAQRTGKTSEMTGTSSEASALEANDMQPLLNREWALESLGPIGSEEPIGTSVKITLEFEEDGRLHGSAGCNRYFGTFKSATQNSLTAGPIGTTMMMCSGEVMDWEIRYLKALQDISSYKIENRHLMLFYDSDEKVLIFIQKDSH